MEKDLKELQAGIMYMHEHFAKIRDDMCRTLGCSSDQFPAKEYSDRANELAQLAMFSLAMMDPETTKEMRTRYASVLLGVKHEERVDFSDIDERR